ncbi:hypothetical protein [Ruegeria atlantica]|uniref:hypothetical protein n=1 Tax=Ruegeria atlantica TaxID=81569 RepID=UPI00147B3DE9|nr:hypothetical protein [Ruegeria atlantica]
MVEYLELTIDELLLDEENPRLGAVGSQSEALDALLRLNQSHFRNLMLSIKRNGLDPGDNLYVIDSEEPEDYVVLDGNRRLAALKVLARPDFLDGTEASASTKKSLLRAAESFDRNEVEPIRCVRFDDRATADDWIYRRHTGDMDGEGRIQWGRTEIQRFTGDRSVLDIIDFVGRNAEYTDAEWAQTKATIESRKSSNIGRLLESAAGKKHIGISISNNGDGKTPMLSADPEWALGVLKRIIEDVRDGVVDSRSHNTASEIEDYFKTLPKELQPPKGKRPAAKAFRDISVKAPGPATSTTTTKAKPRTKGAPRTRATLAPKKLTFQHPPSEKGKQLLREATLIDPKKLPVSSAAVLRAFIEMAVEDYIAKVGLPKMGKTKDGKPFDLSLSQKAESVIQHMTRNKVASSSDLREFRKGVADSKAPASIQSLHGFVHSKYAMPTPEGVRAGWDCCVPVFEATYGKV